MTAPAARDLGAQRCVIYGQAAALVLNARDAGTVDVDLWPVLANGDGALRAEYTSDSLHLNGPGYRAWVETLRPRLKSFERTP